MQHNKLYIGNLPFSVDDTQLRDMFSPCGEIRELKLITDRESGQFKGFAFVTFVNDSDAEKALKLNGKDLSGRQLRVTVAEQREGKGRGELRGSTSRPTSVVLSFPRSTGRR